MSTRKSQLFYGFLIACVSVVGGMVIASRLDISPRSFAGTLNIPVTNSAPLTGAIDASTFRTVAHDASPSVVSILVKSTRKAPTPSEFFGLQIPETPFGNTPRRGQRQPSQEVPVQGAGSGFIIDKAGFILTNNHVIEDAISIEVKVAGMSDLADVPGLSAKVVGRDPLADVALLQLTEMPKTPLVESKFGDSAQMAPGDWVMAIGNPFQLSNTVTVGVVSAVGRPQPVARQRFQDFIQTDAAINHGNSGGPLLNIRGEVVGINTAIYSDNPGEGNVGIGFAVPINTVRDLLPRLREGKVVRGRIGVSVGSAPLTDQDARDLGLPNAAGAEVRDVETRGPAATGGIRAGDVIVDFNGHAIKDNKELVTVVSGTTPGTTVPVKVYRGGKPLSLSVKVAELDLEQEQVAANRPSGPSRSPEAPRESSFGMSLQNVMPSDARQLQLPNGIGGAIVADVTPFGVAAQGGISEGDVILAVQGQLVRSVDEAMKALDAVPVGRIARVVVWHSEQGQPGHEVLLTLRKR